MNMIVKWSFSRKERTMGAVYYKKLIEGTSVPAIIHNSSYFLIQMAVYEDGTVSCWHRSDLEQLQDDLRKGWLVPAVPMGQYLSVYGLGIFHVQEARWKYDAAGYYQYVQDIIRSLNPEMENLYHMTPREKEKWNKARVSWSASPTPYKLKGNFGYNILDGDSKYIFCRKDGRLYLTPFTAYADKSLQIDIMGERFFGPEELDELFLNGVLLTSPKQTEWVSIRGLGEVLLDPADHRALPLKEKQGEIRDTLSRLAGEENSLERCRAAHYQYLCDPCDWTREELRKTYEAVPEHNRMYLGDMDTKDSDFCRILYHPEQKREV